VLNIGVSVVPAVGCGDMGQANCITLPSVNKLYLSDDDGKGCVPPPSCSTDHQPRQRVCWVPGTRPTAEVRLLLERRLSKHDPSSGSNPINLHPMSLVLRPREGKRGGNT